MFSSLGWLPDGVSTCSRLPESLSTWRRIFHPRFFLLGKALKSCPARMGWFSGLSCAPNSDSKEEKEKRRPGDGNAHGPLASESSCKNDQDGLTGSQVLPVNEFLSRTWWQPFPRAWFRVSVTALEKRTQQTCGSLKVVTPQCQRVDARSSPRKPEQLTESPQQLAAHRLLSTGALAEPWATQGSSELLPNMDQASSGVSLGCLCFMGTDYVGFTSGPFRA